MVRINLYLDTRRPRKDGTAAIKLSVNDSKGNTLIPLGYSVRPEDWDSENRCLRRSCPLYSRLDVVLRQAKLDADAVVLDMGRSATRKEVVEALRRTLDPDRPDMSRPTLLDICRRYMELKTEQSTRESYLCLCRHVERFRPETMLEDVNREWLTLFDAHMAMTARSPNARAVYMRNLRAVFNFALDEELTTNYPFRKFKIRTVKTAKRSMSARELRELLTMEVEPWQEPYRDFFALTFFLIGINAKDLLHLKGVSRGRVEYNRAKTKRLYSIRVEPEAKGLIEKYRGKGHLLSFMDGRSDYLQFVRQCNHALQTIGTKGEIGKRRVGVPLWPEVTTYWARHSWATIAASLDIPKETIAAALGHGGQTVTDIYIDFDRRKVDEANRRVIDFVLYGKA